MTQNPSEIDVRTAAARAAAGEVLLLDVREDAEWAAGHAAGATHLAMSRLDVGAVPTDRPVVCVCRSGNRSGQVTAHLSGAGIDIVNMTGGMLAWEAAGLSVVTADGSPGGVA